MIPSQAEPPPQNSRKIPAASEGSPGNVRAAAPPEPATPISPAAPERGADHIPTSDLAAQTFSEIVIAEYQALRAEIGRYQDHQKQLINYVFLIVGGSVTLASEFGTKIFAASPPDMLLFVPLLYTLLAFLYSDRAVRIIRLAHYLHHHARPQVTRVTHVPVWEWETYKNETEVVSRRVAFLLDKLRWAVFIMPLVVTSIFTTFGLRGVSGDYRIWSAAVGIVSLLLAVLAALLTEETSGTVHISYRRGRR